MKSLNEKSILLGFIACLSVGAVYFIMHTYVSMHAKIIADHYNIKTQEESVLVTKLVDELQEIKKIVNTMLQHQVQAINREIIQSRNNNQRPQQQESQSSCRQAQSQAQESARAVNKKVTEILTKDDLQSLLDSNNNPSVLFFHMNGCSWCKKMDPVFDEVANNPLFSNVKFYRIEGRASQAGELVQKAFNQKISGFPTLLFINNGKYVDKQVGFAKQEEFESNIKKNLQK